MRNITKRRKPRSKLETPTYGSWLSMRRRCYQKSLRAYRNYGGRGIKVCERWNSFENFLVDMGERPPGTSLDRIDNNGDYCPDNCRWATRKVQNRNSRAVRLLTAFGKTQCIADWADEYGINSHCISVRLHKGWSVEAAIATPKFSRRVCNA